MSAHVDLSLLLFVFISKIQAEEPTTILEEKGSYTIKLPEATNFCMISRFVGEQKLVLWNTSGLWSQNNTVPEDLKEQCSFIDRVNISSNIIHNLTHSDSGLYQVECWTKGNMIHKKNESLTVCSRIHEMRSVQGTFGRTVDLECQGAADNLTVQWLRHQGGNTQEEKWTRVSSDNKKSLMDNEEDRLQVVKSTSTLRVSNFNRKVFGPYTCLVMNKQRCISSHPVTIIIQSEVIYHSVGETAMLNCTVNNASDDQLLYWTDPSNTRLQVKSPQNLSDSFSNFTKQQQNVSSVNPDINRNILVLSSLSINSTGVYICVRSYSWASIYMVVCPTFGPPAIEYFYDGDMVTLECNHSMGREYRPIWFMKTDHAKGTVVKVNQFYGKHSTIKSKLRNKVEVSISNDNMVLSNVSMEDRGEYWCAVVDRNSQCIFTAKTLLIYRGSFWLYITSNALRSLLLVILCVVVLTVNYTTRRREQLSDI